MRIERLKAAIPRFPVFRPMILGRKYLNLIRARTAPKTVWCRNDPLTVQIEHTARCNLRCPMCVRESFQAGEMTLAQYESVVAQLKGTLKIHLQGNGEPFLHPRVFDMILASVSQSQRVSVVTNGTLLDDRRIPRILRAHLHEVCISVDGPDKPSFEAIRVGADFDRVKTGIRRLAGEIAGRKIPTEVILFVTVLRSNLHRLPEFVRFAADVLVRRINFQRVQTKDDFLSYYTEGFKQSGEFVTAEEVGEAVARARPEADRMGIRLEYEEAGSRCRWPWWGAYITWTGEVTPCCMVFDTSSLPLGNVFQTPFREIWNGPNYQRLRRSFLERKPLPLCRGCRYF